MTDRRKEQPRLLRGAIVGYGFISSGGHVPAYAAARGQIEIVAVADTCRARRDRARDALPNARIYEDHASLLLGEAGRLDFIDITTPPSEHARIARAALARGLHVLCEKPVATTADDVRIMIADAQRARRVLFPSHNYKHAPVIAAVRRIIDAGTIGRVRLVTLQTFRTTHARGVPEWRPDWRRERRWSGGGVAMDHGSHTFYLAFDWLRAYPISISARATTLGRFDTEDNLSCTMTFPEGLATAELSWTAGVRKVIYTIHGERGAIRVEDDDLEVSARRPSAGGHIVIQERSRQRVSSEWSDASHSKWFESLFAQFVRTMRGEEDASRQVEDALRCIEVIATAYASAADAGREYALPGATHRARLSM
jgi:predicted dehydrogenase